MQRLRIKLNGQVQGVGMRPHIYRLAISLGLTGWVRNDSAGVTLEIQGDILVDFLTSLRNDLPPLATIESFECQYIGVVPEEQVFVIIKSEMGKAFTKISPDVAICEICLEELFSPLSRFYRYPFINCMHCGPRYTIIRQLPYDRSTTSMSDFVMCKSCQSEYDDPLNRRYHAQPIACQVCGPKINMPIEKISEAISLGKIVALKGMGGYQLICDATNKETLYRLRENKKRRDKPFAIMLLNYESAKRIVVGSPLAKKLLNSKERPIVLLPKRNTPLPDSIAPNLSTLGVMLPSTPMHYLLFNSLLGMPEGILWLKKTCKIMLVVTSANLGGAPLIKDDNIAEKDLINIADIIVSYNRKIVTRVDDSVVSPIANRTCYVRRARGYVPSAIPLPYEIPVTLALGAYKKNTICITRGKEAFVSQHIGNLNNRENIQFYNDTIQSMLKALDVKPQCVACDFHQDFYSSQIADAFDTPIFPIQHHHAHLATCAVEYPKNTKMIGLALDGFGLGENQENWGGELLYYQSTGFKRLGSFKPIMQPGGDVAIRQPWRMAASILFELGYENLIPKRFSQQPHSSLIIEMLKRRTCSPLTSSCGRLFDAASALLGICEVTNYDGKAAMALESKVNKLVVMNSGWNIENNQLSLLPLFNFLLTCNQVEGANLFHGTLVEALANWLESNARELDITHILLSGGCFLNKILSEALIENLQNLGLVALIPTLCPPNDGGISLGQAWIAGNKMREQQSCA